MKNLRRFTSLASLILFAATALPAQANKPSPCTASEYRQLDFWVGDWDAFDIDDQKVPAARAHVSPILQGCSLLEDYQQVDGLHGQSFSTYDASRGVWHQTWVTNRGSLLVVEGKMEGDKLVLRGTDNIRKADYRVTWERDSKGVRETAVSSKDGGKTWQPVFDMVFRPHAGAEGEQALKDLTIELENRPGALGEMGEALGRVGVSIEGGGAWVVNGTGVAHFLVEDGEVARRALEAAGIRVVAVRDVIVQKVKQDEPGQLGKLTRRMGEAGVNIEVLYSDHGHHMILVVDDVEKGRAVSEAWTRERSRQ